MTVINRRQCINLISIVGGVCLALVYFDPFTVKLIKNAVLKGERVSQVYEFGDEIRTGSIGNVKKDAINTLPKQP